MAMLAVTGYVAGNYSINTVFTDRRISAFGRHDI
jgi:hypothetical protein